MTTLTDSKLNYYNEQGLVPGPNENEMEFLKRVEFCLNLNSELDGEIPFRPEEKADLSHFCEVRKETAERFGITPDWVPIFFSNYQLYPWHGGCAWIFQLRKETPTSALLQLRKKLHRSKKLFAFYDRDELIAHELSHVGRMVFKEPHFEEVIAYTTSQSPFRRYFGPIIQSSIESFLFMIVLMGIVILDTYLILRYPFAYWQAMWLKIIPLAMIAFALFRLWRKQSAYKRCCKNLFEIIKEKKKTDAALYRLTDEEISSFAKWDSNKIKDYIQSQTSLRWRAIKSCAFCAV